MKLAKILMLLTLLVISMQIAFSLIGVDAVANNLKLETSSNKLEFNENLTSIATSLDSNYLSILHDGTIDNEYGTFDYKQTLYLPKGRVVFAKDSSNSSGLHVNNVPKDYLLLPQGSEGYRLKISFSPALKSDHNTANSGYLEDLINEKIMLLGREYEIIKAEHPLQDSIALTLISGNMSFVFNDTDTHSTSAGGSVTFNNNLFNDVKVDIKSSGDEGTTSGADVYISSIEIYYLPQEDLYIGKGENASTLAGIIENQSALFLDAFDIKYEGLSLVGPEDIKLRFASSNDYKLEFTNKAGIRYSTPVWAQASSTSNITVGDNIGSTVRNLNIFENQSIQDEDLFIVSKNKYSRILQFKDVDPGVNNTDTFADGAGLIKIKDVGSGDLFEVSYTALQGDLVLDGNTYKVNVTSDATIASLYVDLDGSGNNPAKGTAIVNQLYTQNGAIIQLGVRNSSNTITVPGHGTYSSDGIAEMGYNMSYAIFSSEKDDDNAITNITIVFGRNDDNEIDIARIEGTNILSNKAGDLYIYEDYIYNKTPSDAGNKLLPAYGYFVSWDKKSANESDQDDLAISYPDNQTKVNVYIFPGTGTALPSFPVVAEELIFGANTPLNNGRTVKNQAVINVSYPLLETIQDTLSEGETKIYGVSGKEYEVTLDFVGSTQAKFTVNGEVTNALGENQKHVLSDNSELFVIDILSQEFGGGTRKVIFNLTAAKAVTLTSCTLEWNGTNESMPVTSEGCMVAKQTVEGQSYTFKAFVWYSSGKLAISQRINFKENTKPTGTAFITNSPKSSSSVNNENNIFSENINYTQSLNKNWNILWIPATNIMETFWMNFSNTYGWNISYVLSERGKLGDNYTAVYYNHDGTDGGWKVFIRGDWAGSDLQYVNNTNDKPYWINMSSADKFEI